MPRWLPTYLLVAALFAHEVQAGPWPEPPDAVKKLQSAMAMKIGAMVSSCQKYKLREEGRTLLARALALDPENPALLAFNGKLEGPTEAIEQRKASFAKDLEKLEKSLAAMQEQVVAAELKAAESQPIMRQASGHELRYILSLPRGWKRGGRYTILVTVEGAGCGWIGNHKGFAGQRGDRLIILTPITFSNTNELQYDKYPYSKEIVDKYKSGDRMSFDEPGLLAALADVQKQCDAEERCFITGFSGGGNLAWRMVFGHPEKLHGAAPACANFSNPGAIGKDPEARAALPIRAFQGETDQYLDSDYSNLNKQWAACKAVLDSNGYKTYERVMLPGVGHSPCTGKVIEFVNERLANKK